MNLVILEDSFSESWESVLLYLTQVTGGARIATGTLDGGIKVRVKLQGETLTDTERERVGGGGGGRERRDGQRQRQRGKQTETEKEDRKIEGAIS